MLQNNSATSIGPRTELGSCIPIDDDDDDDGDNDYDDVNDDDGDDGLYLN
jgi:hypothetical protein